MGCYNRRGKILFKLQDYSWYSVEVIVNGLQYVFACNSQLINNLLLLKQNIGPRFKKEHMLQNYQLQRLFTQQNSDNFRQPQWIRNRYLMAQSMPQQVYMKLLIPRDSVPYTIHSYMYNVGMLLQHIMHNARKERKKYSNMST